MADQEREQSQVLSRKNADVSKDAWVSQRLGLGGAIVAEGHTDTESNRDIQFDKPVTKIPIKAISLAAGLFIAGSALLLAGLVGAKFANSTWPMLIFGALMFIPGVYHVRIAYYAYRGYEGYTYDMIPHFE